MAAIGLPPLCIELQYAVGHVRKLKEKLAAETESVKKVKERNMIAEAELDELCNVKSALSDDLAQLRDIERSVEREVPIHVLRGMDEILEYEVESQEKVRENLCTLRLMVHELLIRTIHNERMAQRELASEERSFSARLVDGDRARTLMTAALHSSMKGCERDLKEKQELYNHIKDLEQYLLYLDAELYLVNVTKHRIEDAIVLMGGRVRSDIKRNERASGSRSVETQSSQGRIAQLLHLRANRRSKSTSSICNVPHVHEKYRSISSKSITTILSRCQLACSNSTSRSRQPARQIPQRPKFRDTIYAVHPPRSPSRSGRRESQSPYRTMRHVEVRGRRRSRQGSRRSASSGPHKARSVSLEHLNVIKPVVSVVRDKLVGEDEGTAFRCFVPETPKSPLMLKTARGTTPRRFVSFTPGEVSVSPGPPPQEIPIMEGSDTQNCADSRTPSAFTSTSTQMTTAIDAPAPPAINESSSETPQMAVDISKSSLSETDSGTSSKQRKKKDYLPSLVRHSSKSRSSFSRSHSSSSGTRVAVETDDDKGLMGVFKSSLMDVIYKVIEDELEKPPKSKKTKKGKSQEKKEEPRSSSSKKPRKSSEKNYSAKNLTFLI